MLYIISFLKKTMFNFFVYIFRLKNSYSQIGFNWSGYHVSISYIYKALKKNRENPMSLVLVYTIV